MGEYNIKTKTSDKCRVYPDNPGGIAPSVTSITACLMKWALVDWAANCAVDYLYDMLGCEGNYDWGKIANEARVAHKDISKEARDKGTDIHELCQVWLESFHMESQNVKFAELMETADENAVAMIHSFIEWCTKNKIEPVHIEIKLHGDGYSGRCDLVAYRTCPKTGERRLGLYDIKTGKGSYYPEWGLQLGAYAEALEYMNLFSRQTLLPADEIGISEIGIIKLNKDTLKCNFSEQSKPKFTAQREMLTKAFLHLKDFYWAFNDLAAQFRTIDEGEG